jgi:hypothetical protein
MPNRKVPAQPEPPRKDDSADREEEDLLDEAIEETFPASDPIAPAVPRPHRPQKSG